MRSGGLYLAIGDSTTYGIVTAGSYLYASYIQQQIKANYGVIRLVNLGLSGTTSTDTLTNLMIGGYTLEPDLVTIGLGMNDAHDSISTSTYESNLQAIIAHLQVQNPNVQVILCAPNTINSASNEFSNMPDTALTPYRSAMATVAAGYGSGVGICHFENGWTVADSATYVNSDGTGGQGIHPNDTGHPVLGALLYPIIQMYAASFLASLGRTV